MPKMSDGSDMERAEPKRWTVMVYMAAGSNTELDATAVQDIREMERGLNGDTHVVVQINRAWPDSFQRYHIHKSKSEPRRGISTLVGVDDDTTDMGDRETLTKFLEWSVEKFPATHYFLVLWGHSYGLGFGRDHNNALTLRELKRALDAFSAARRRVSKKKSPKAKIANKGRLELLGANACAMSYVESAYELRNSARFLVASQISVPFAGWPYESILKRLPPRARGPGSTRRRYICESFQRLDSRRTRRDDFAEPFRSCDDEGTHSQVRSGDQTRGRCESEL